MFFYKICFFFLIILLSNYVLAIDNGWSKYHYIIFNQDIPKLKKILLADKKNINKKSTAEISPLHLAVKMRNLEIVQILIKNGADINIQDKNGLTPLHYSLSKNLNKISKFLIKQDEEIDIELKNNYGITPLMQASYSNNEKMLIFLLDKGAKVDEKNINGSTACQLAYAKKNIIIVDILISLTNFKCNPFYK